MPLRSRERGPTHGDHGPTPNTDVLSPSRLELARISAPISPSTGSPPVRHVTRPQDRPGEAGRRIDPGNAANGAPVAERVATGVSRHVERVAVLAQPRPQSRRIRWDFR